MSFTRTLQIASACFLVATVAEATPVKPFKNEDSWPKARVGSKTCMITHTHNGFSPSWPSLKGAKAYAIRDWVSHTKWEYGAQWASWKLSFKKQMKCKSAGGRHECVAYANPCRR